jgi:light-regulated signal transduction histidine kinase (bacteriophytochrome)
VINDILDFSKIEPAAWSWSASLQPARTWLDAARAGVAAEAKGLELSFRVAPDVPDRLVGDDGRLRQIVVNLVSNAIKFTERGDVVVELEQERLRDGRSRCTWSCATPASASRRTAERDLLAVHPGDGTTTRRYGGTGLGSVDLSCSSRC